MGDEWLCHRALGDRGSGRMSERVEKAPKRKTKIRLLCFGIDCKCKCSDELCKSFFFAFCVSHFFPRAVCFRVTVLCVLISFQSLRFFAFGSFTFLFYHFHVVCFHHNPLSLSLPFFLCSHTHSHSFSRSFWSLHPFSWVFLHWQRFFSSNFFCIYFVLARSLTLASHSLSLSRCVYVYGRLCHVVWGISRVVQT